MELTLQPSLHPPYPLAGVLIRGARAAHWAQELHRMGIGGKGCAVYPIPGTAAGSIWGCLAVPERLPPGNLLDRNLFCRLAGGALFLPDHAALWPLLKPDEISKLLNGNRAILHPDFGLYYLTAQLDWRSLLTVPTERSIAASRPADGVRIPETVRSFQVQSAEPDDVLQSLEEKAFPKTEELKDEPLNSVEALRLRLYRMLFRKAEGRQDGTSEKTGFGRRLEQMLRPFSKEDGKPPLDRMEHDWDALEARNNSELDKLMNLFRNNPEEALKYAIPLDGDGAGRGGMGGTFELAQRWNNFSLFGANRSGGSGSASFADDAYWRLQEQYRKTAADLKAAGAYEKAAFVYLKLLKQPYDAAAALEEGGLFAEAASLYLKQTGNKAKAAECYEKGRMTTRAIDLYKELEQHEKVGDLYAQLAQQDAALAHYGKACDAHAVALRYRDAAALSRFKMDDAERANEYLLEGWRKGRDGIACLQEYFGSIERPAERASAIERTYHRETTAQNSERFLHALRSEADSEGALGHAVREIAYEIIAGQVSTNPEILSELRVFNKQDVALVRDVMRYKVARRKRRR